MYNKIVILSLLFLTTLSLESKSEQISPGIKKEINNQCNENKHIEQETRIINIQKNEICENSIEENEKSVLNDIEKQILDNQIEHNLNCQRKLRILMNPLIEDFIVKNFEKIEKFKNNEAELTESEKTIIDELVNEFCQKNIAVVSSFAIEVYEVSHEPKVRENFLYAFKKSFAISFKEEFINNLEMQRRILKVVKNKEK